MSARNPPTEPKPSVQALTDEHARVSLGVFMSDERVPMDRRIFYAFMLLGGLRPGEARTARFRH
jgi:hypothetical protein